MRFAIMLFKNPPISKMYTKVQAINALANYFIQREEVQAPPRKKSAKQQQETDDILKDTPVIKAVISKLQNGDLALGKQSSYDLLELADILNQWARELAGTIEDDLRQQGLLDF